MMLRRWQVNEIVLYNALVIRDGAVAICDIAALYNSLTRSFLIGCLT